MDVPTITCAQVDGRDLDVRYLAGELSDEDAAAFEAHYFECDGCWALVRGGLAVRAGAVVPGAAASRPDLPPAAPDSGLPPGTDDLAPGARRSRWPQVLALAAGIGALAVGLWRFGGPDRPPNPDTLRGAVDSLPVTAELEPPVWRASWPAVTGATRYRIRIFAADGTLRREREVADTAILGDAAELGEGAVFYVDVAALDATRRPAARSALTRLRAPSDSG